MCTCQPPSAATEIVTAVLERVTLRLDEPNDVRFDVRITASRPLTEGGSNKVLTRLVCELDDHEVAFVGEPLDDGSIGVVVPALSGRLRPGVYAARLEVVVEGRHFVPLRLDVELVEPTKVVVETTRVVRAAETEVGVQVVAAAVVDASATRVVAQRSKSLDEMDELMAALGGVK